MAQFLYSYDRGVEMVTRFSFYPFLMWTLYNPGWDSLSISKWTKYHNFSRVRVRNSDRLSYRSKIWVKKKSAVSAIRTCPEWVSEQFLRVLNMLWLLDNGYQKYFSCDTNLKSYGVQNVFCLEGGRPDHIKDRWFLSLFLIPMFIGIPCKIKTWHKRYQWKSSL